LGFKEEESTSYKVAEEVNTKDRFDDLEIQAGSVALEGNLEVIEQLYPSPCA
jgi:hypothetical protein